MIPVIGALFNFKKLMLPLIIVTVIGGLIMAGKAYIDNKDKTITTLQSVIGSKNIEINQLNNNISTLNGTVIGLKDEIIESKYRRRLVENQVANLRRVNSAVQEELRKKEKKLAGRVAGISAVQLTDATADGYVKSFDPETMVMIPVVSEIQDVIDTERGFTDNQASKSHEAYWIKDTEGDDPDVLVFDEDGNPTFSQTLDDTMNDLRARDIDGDIIPDLTYEEAADVIVLERKTTLATNQVTYAVENQLEVPAPGNEISTGSATISGTTLTDDNGSFVTDEVTVDDFIKCAGMLYKVESVDSETAVTLNKSATVMEAQPYTVINSPFMAQFIFSIV